MIKLLKGHLALQKCLELSDINTVLDFGCGPGLHTKGFLKAGKDVTGLDIYRHEDFPEAAEFTTELSEIQHYDLIWSSHVLEHIENPIDLLRKFNRLAKYTCITVPPMKPEIVSGHVNLYSAGLLMYHMVLAGYDMSKCKIKTYGYNISVIVQNKTIKLPKLHYDYPDLNNLKQYFPEGYNFHGFNGNIAEHNWR